MRKTRLHPFFQNIKVGKLPKPLTGSITIPITTLILIISINDLFSLIIFNCFKQKLSTLKQTKKTFDFLPSAKIDLLQVKFSYVLFIHYGKQLIQI